MSKVIFSQHALLQMQERGASRSEVVKTIEDGECVPAKKGRQAFRLNFQYNGSWVGRRYRIKQVMPVIIEETNKIIVITVYVFYF